MARTENSHRHLELTREEPVTNRRPPRGFPRPPPPDNVRQHGELLHKRLRTAREGAATNLGGYDERRLIKIELEDKVPPEDVAKALGRIEVVSQEEGKLILAFASEAKLEEFEAKLTSLAVGEQVTYRNVLYALKDLGHWTAEDRTGWALKRDGLPEDETFVLDVELWPLARGNEADRLRGAFEAWLQERDGQVVDSVRQPYLTVFRVRCSRELAEKLLLHRDVRTVDLPPRVSLEDELSFVDVQQLDAVPSPPIGAPGIVVLDSGLSTGHPVLAPAVGDAQSFLDGTSSADDHGHGTFVSCIALYDDVADCLRKRSFVPNLTLYSGRVLDRHNLGDSELIENQVERAVRYFSDEYGCRIFCLSYGDLNKPYRGRHVAGLAVTLDALSRKLSVLFVVPTGNFLGTEDGPEDWCGEYPGYLTAESATLLDPAPALNALTVGSIARYERNETWPNDPGYRAVARVDQPSPFTRSGPSVNRAIKPDLVDYGGNMMIDVRAGGQVMMGPQGVGELSASHTYATGRPFREDFGTSFAVPRVAHAAARILREFPRASVDLCRALLAAHARTPDACSDLFAGNDNALRDVTGYGLVDRSALYRSLVDCVTLWAEESIGDRKHHFYEIPVPDGFWSGARHAREITVSLAYRPDVRTTRIDYRAGRISFKFVQARSLDEVIRRFDASVNKEATTNVIERSSGRGISKTTRSRGTLQASTWTFMQPSRSVRESSWFVIVTRNDPAWGRNFSSEREPYALVVMLADRLLERPLLRSLYLEVEARLRARVRARVRR